MIQLCGQNHHRIQGRANEFGVGVDIVVRGWVLPWVIKRC